jgi:heterotetrameric sarcosine oxidase delta subunit
VNTAGEHDEIWQHAGGCRAHLRVTRNTLTHKISSIAFARDHGRPHERRKAETPA